MSSNLPFYDYKIDKDGQLILGQSGVNTVTDDDLIRQVCRNIIMLNFKGTDYMALPNNQTTGTLIKEDLTDMLQRDSFINSLGLTVLVDIFPQDLNSMGFSVILTNGDTQIDLGVDAFLNLRAGIIVGMGDFKLEPTIYKQTIRTTYERLRVSKPGATIALANPLIQGRQVYIFNQSNITGFANGLPTPLLTPDTGSFVYTPGIKLLPLSDFLQSSGFLRVYNIVLTQADGAVIDPAFYSIVGTYIVFDGLEYSGTINVQANLVDVAGDVIKYTETNGLHPVDIYSSARENKEYLVTLSGNMPNGTYFIVYDTFEVL